MGQEPDIHVLVIDDHHLMIEGYKTILHNSDIKRKIIFYSANSCEEAYHFLTNRRIALDVIILDVALPPCDRINIQSGVDLIPLFRTYNVDSKLLIITAHDEVFLIYDWIKDYKPDGILIKSDFKAEEFADIFNNIMNGQTIYSPDIKKRLAKIINNELYLDQYNRHILMLLGQGIKTKNLPLYLPLSLSSIDKRKAQIKEYLGLNEGDDVDIVQEAKRLKLI